MKEYREKLKVNLGVMIAAAVILITFSLWAMGAEFMDLPFPKPAGDEHWISMWRGFASGASFGVAVVLFAGIWQAVKALRSEEKLKKLYIRENDEREQMVCRTAAATALRSFLLLSLVAVIIAGYFSITVAMTLMATVLVQSFFALGFKLYYRKKF